MNANNDYGLRELGALLFGALLGVVIAYALNAAGLNDPREIAAAREAGIVSLTVLKGYAKSRDTLNALWAFSMPVICALLAHRLAGRPAGTVPAGSADRFPTRSATLGAVIATALLGFWSWHAGQFLMPAWNPYVGAWPYLGEEGATLAWIQRLNEGGVYGKDFFALYGPMFVYPLHWLMGIIGDVAVVERYYKLILQMAAFALLAFVLLRNLRSRTLAIALVVLIAHLYPPLIAPSANTSVLRVALPLFALSALALSLDGDRRAWRWTAGAVLGQAILFSQEAGISALLASGAVLLLDRSGATPPRPAAIAGRLLAFGGIVFASMAPMTAYLLVQGAGPAMLDSLLGYPRLVMLGFGAQQFPSLTDWLGGDFRAYWIHYAVLTIYAGSAIALATRWRRTLASPRRLWALAVLLFGLLLFRQALGRSDADQTIKVLLPALLLSGFWIDALAAGLPEARRAGQPWRLRAVLAVTVTLHLLAGIALDPLVRERAHLAWVIGTTLDGKFDAAAEGRIHPRLGFPLDQMTERSVDEIGGFLARATQAGEPVLFFPNEAAYYHLFERPNPTRYALAYLAASYARQREMIADLERAPPRFVVVSKRTWRIDGIPENVQVPLLVDYLARRYRFAESLPTVDILVRR